MQVRLGFSISAFVDPDVLIVDEVLAVGDAAFQRRSEDRMRQLHAAGCTLVLVTHDLTAAETICERAVWLREGRVEADGPAMDVVDAYLKTVGPGLALAEVELPVRATGSTSRASRFATRKASPWKRPWPGARVGSGWSLSLALGSRSLTSASDSPTLASGFLSRDDAHGRREARGH